MENKLLESSLKIQRWIKSHPRKASIVADVLNEFDKAIEIEEATKTEFYGMCKTCEHWQKYDDYTNAGSCTNEQTNKNIDGTDIMFLENFGCRNYSINPKIITSGA